MFVLNLSRSGDNTNTILLLCLFAAAAFGIFEFVSGRATSPMVLGIAIVLGLVAAYVALRNAVESNTRQLREAGRLHLATVEALATAIDARDQIGVGHVRRIQIYAVGLGNLLGLNEADISALRTGALLHDIGKLAVPDHILNKPGALTPSEMEKVKIHSSVGASILEKVGFPYPVVPTVRYHHEFWDGSGYPEGLKGRNIPLTARILAIADAYDSAREARPYRPAMAKEEAINHIRSRSGIQFDPMLVDLLLKNLPIFEAEIRRCGVDHDGVTVEPLRDHTLDAYQSPDYVEQIKRANREAFTLYSLAREFSSSLDLEETMELFSRKMAEFVPFDTFVVYLLDRGGRMASAAHASGNFCEKFAHRRISLEENPSGTAIGTRKPVWNADPAAELPDNVDDLLVMASVPLIAEDELLGAVSLYSGEINEFQEEHLRLIETISCIAADAINVALQHAVAESHALTDPLTGLPNSRSLMAQFDREVMRASRSESRFQLLVMDLDGFKNVNDTFGHKAGDEVLKGIGGAISSELREYDFLARYGGDEFVAIVPETDAEHAASLHERIERVVANYRLPVGEIGTASVGISLGSASYPQHGTTFDALIEAADKAMYTDKAQNRNRPDHDESPSPEELDEWLRSGSDPVAVTSNDRVMAATSAVN